MLIGTIKHSEFGMTFPVSAISCGAIRGGNTLDAILTDNTMYYMRSETACDVAAQDNESHANNVKITRDEGLGVIFVLQCSVSYQQNNSARRERQDASAQLVVIKEDCANDAECVETWTRTSSERGGHDVEWHEHVRKDYLTKVQHIHGKESSDRAQNSVTRSVQIALPSDMSNNGKCDVLRC